MPEEGGELEHICLVCHQPMSGPRELFEGTEIRGWLCLNPECPRGAHNRENL